jgi:hypothetical protein
MRSGIFGYLLPGDLQPLAIIPNIDLGVREGWPRVRHDQLVSPVRQNLTAKLIDALVVPN